jgi:hypothetical protein
MHHDLQVNPIMEVSMLNVMEDTLNCRASFYLDESGHELASRDEFIRRMRGMHGVMLYVGSGYVKLQVAVLTFERTNWSDPTSSFEEWARNNDRAEEIGEDSDWASECNLHPDNSPEATYELHIENIPTDVGVDTPFDETYKDLRVYEAGNGFYITHIPTDTTRGMGDGTERGWDDGMVEAEYNDLMDAYFDDIPKFIDLEIHAYEYMEENDNTGNKIARQVAAQMGLDPKADIKNADYHAAVMAYIVSEEDDYEHLKMEMRGKHPMFFVHCNQCRLSTAQGVLLHEKGCPNDMKTWIPGRGWVYIFKCRECGCDIEEGEHCTCMDAVEDESEGG